MKVRIIEGKEGYPDLVSLNAESTAEADLLESMFKDGVRVVSGGRWSLTVGNPRLAGLRTLYVSEEEAKLLHDALVDAEVGKTDCTLGRLIKELR